MTRRFWEDLGLEFSLLLHTLGFIPATNEMPLLKRFTSLMLDTRIIFLIDKRLCRVIERDRCYEFVERHHFGSLHVIYTLLNIKDLTLKLFLFDCSSLAVSLTASL